MIAYFAEAFKVTVIGNGHSNMSSNPEQDCISYNANILGKGMNPVILLPSMGK